MPLYSKCCYAASCRNDAAFCNECGNSLLRCTAFHECGGLADEDGFCSHCIAPVLVLESDVSAKAAVGGRQTITLQLQNRSPARRSLHVPNLWYREKEDDWKSISPGWDLLTSNQANPFSVTINDLDKVGVHKVEFLIAVTSRWKWRSETYSFVASMEIVVDKSKDVVVQQNIHYSADAPQTGATIYAPIRVESNEESHRPSTAGPKELRLTRARVFARQFGLRGNANGTRVKRNTQFRWTGFEKGESPFDGLLMAPENRWLAGRSRTRAQGGDTDIRLLVRNQDGSIDEDLSRAISRNHFSLYVENDRLMIRSESDAGTSIDGKRLQRGESIAINDGSLVSPLPQSPQHTGLRFRFETEHDEVVKVNVTRV